VLVALMGCSSDDSPNNANPGGGTSSGNPVNPDGGPVGPSGPDGHAFWTKSTNIAHYKIFPDRAAAIAWFTGVQGRGDTGLESDKPVPATDGRYADIDKKVEEVWKGFQAGFQADTQDLPTPIVVLVDSPKPGAYALWDPDLGLSPNVFMIQTPTLTLGDDAIRGVIAHELAHHVLKHKWPGVSDKIEIWYDATKTVEHGFGFEQANDAAIKKTGKTAQVYGQSTGDYPLTQWNGATRRGGTLDDFVGYVHVKAKATNAAACADADTAYEAMLAYADPYRDRATNTLTMTPDQLTQLDSLSKTYIAKETTCTSVVKDGFFKVVGEALGISEADAREQATPEEIAAADQSTSAFDALVRITKKYDEYMTTNDYKNTRYFSFEEQADDTSIGVLKNLGFAADGITTYLKKGALDETALAKCNALGTTNEPPYGIISDPHHSTCWRIWHTTKVVAFVSSP
jgi:hypothetical protein